jgi:hypothetical protein
MLGSNFVIIERMKQGVFIKFAWHLLELAGFTNIGKYSCYDREIRNFTAVRDSKTFIVRAEKSKTIIDLPYIKSISDYRYEKKADYVQIITQQEFSSEAIEFASNNGIILLGRLELEKWLIDNFQSCESFINYLIDFNIRSAGIYSIKELTDNYFLVKAALYRQPHEHEMRHISQIKSASYFYKFGTWNNFLASIGENANFMNFKPNRTQTASMLDLIESYIEVRKKLDRPPTTVEIDLSGKFPHEFYLIRFGSWSNFIMIIENEITKSENITQNQINEEFFRVKNILNNTPTYTDMKKHSGISPTIIIYKYQSWNNFLESLNEYKQYSNIDVKEFIKAYMELEKRLHKKPSYMDMKKHCKYTSETMEYKFGQWTNFTRLMLDKEYATLEIKEIDVFTDYYRVRNILKKELISISEIERYTRISAQDYLNYFKTWDNFFDNILKIDFKCTLISEEDMIYEYLDLMSKFNMTSLTLYDMKNKSNFYYPLYLCKFKSWAEFVIRIKDYIRLNVRSYHATDVELLEEYFRLEKKLGISPIKYDDVQKYGKYSPQSYTKRFGTWKKFLTSIGLKSKQDTDKEDIIKEYYRIKNELNKGIIYGIDFNKYSKYSMTIVKRLFGGWINFLNEIKEDSSYYHRPTKEELIEDYFRVKNLLGKDKIFVKEINKYGKFSRSSYTKYFGSWSKFLIKINENYSKNRTSEKELVDEYYRVKKIIGKDYISLHEFEKKSKYSRGPYYSRFGTWNKFLESIGDIPKYNISWENVSDSDFVNDYLSVRKLLAKKYPSNVDINMHGKFTRKKYEKRFGKWSKFIAYFKDLEKDAKS